LVALALAEGALRILDPFGISYHAHQRRFADPQTGPIVQIEARLGEQSIPTRRLKPDYQGFFGFPLRTNHLGMRGGPISKAKPKDTLRILCLGDSVTFGLGVDEESTFVALLERQLNERSGARHTEVLNGAVPGWGGMDELLYLRDEGMSLEPDVVLLVFIPNDILDLTSPEEKESRQAEAGLLGRFFLGSSAFDGLYLHSFFKHLYWLRLQRRGDLERLAGIRNFEQNPVALDAYRQCLAMMVELTGARARLVVVDTLGRDYMKRFAGELGLQRMTILPDVEATPPEFRLSEVDAHPNRACHKFIADKILEQLVLP
jgi:hypothetical protein